MVQYIIRKENSWAFMRKAYRKFFIVDRYWHYFYEDDYMLVRISKKNLSFEEYLRKKNVRFEFRHYEDPNELVRKYQKEFEKIFHLYAVLSMKLRKEELFSCQDRIIHCFNNMNWELQVKNNIMSESQLVGTYLIGRARQEGMQLARQNDKK